jgi:hypothetical protein
MLLCGKLGQSARAPAGNTGAGKRCRKRRRPCPGGTKYEGMRKERAFASAIGVPKDWSVLLR